MITVVLGVGYIGSRLVQALLAEGREVVGLDNFYATDRRAIDVLCQLPGFHFVEGSILDPRAVDETLAADVGDVYLLAAQSSTGASQSEPDYTERVNLQGPRVVLDAMVRRGLVGPLVYGSSTRVYGSPLPLIVDEGSPFGSFADLAHLSKCYVEKLLEMYAQNNGIATSAVRLGLTHGVAPVMKTDPRFMTAPNLFCHRAARGEALELRSADPLALIQVDDAVAALRLAASATPRGTATTFNAATEVRTLREIADALADVVAAHGTGRLSVVDRVSQAPVTTHPVVRSKLGVHGFQPHRTLDDGLWETFAYFAERTSGAEECR